MESIGKNMKRQRPKGWLIKMKEELETVAVEKNKNNNRKND